MLERLDLSAPAQFALGHYQDSVNRALDELCALNAVKRAWERDGHLWANTPQTVADVEARLGWLDLPVHMADELPRLRAFAHQAQQDGFTQVVLLGMGGSSLAPEVMRNILGRQAGYLDLRVLDTTDPAEIRHTQDSLDLAHTLFLVSSKSGTTAETTSLYLYFRALLEECVGANWPRHMVAIADPGTPLAALAQQTGFRAYFAGPADVGGRYSALSFFGLAPAALIGANLDALLASARAMSLTSAPHQPAWENTSLLFGAAMGELARTSCLAHDKLTLITSPALAPFGPWAEQLVAESTGKLGVGIVPVEGEPVYAADRYGRDRLFVYLRLATADNTATDALATALHTAGHPLISFCLPDLHALGGEFWRWEFATSIAGQRLGVNPFDQPNVESAKQQARQALARYQETRRLEEPQPTLTDDGLVLYGPSPLADQETPATYLQHFFLAAPGDYVAIMAYVERNSANSAQLQRLRQILSCRTGLATTVGFGPRFLHSTGQLHKGGPAGGIFLQITQDDAQDLAIPGQPYSFGILKRAQALGDLQALQQAGRRVLRVHLTHTGPDALAHLIDALADALSACPQERPNGA